MQTHRSPSPSVGDRDGDSVDGASLDSREPLPRERVFEALFEAHYENLCRYATARTGSAHIAEDIVQTVFGGLWEREALPEHPKAYLFRGVKNRTINHNQQQRVLRRADADWEARPPRGTDRADAELERQALAAAVRQAVEALPERQRQVFDLSRNGDLTYAEIAEVLSLSVKTVETHMGRALKALRKRLGERL